MVMIRNDSPTSQETCSTVPSALMLSSTLRSVWDVEISSAESVSMIGIESSIVGRFANKTA